MDKGGGFYNISMKSLLKYIKIGICSPYKEETYVATKKFVKTLNGKFGEYLTSISKNKYIGKLGDLVNECSNTYLITVKMKPIDVRKSAYIDFGIKDKDKGPKLELGDQTRKSIYKKTITKR